MFTGLIEEVGTVTSVHRRGNYQQLEVTAGIVLDGTVRGDSIAIDGACQTVTGSSDSRFSVDTLAVSLEKTTLGGYRPGRRVNLERAVLPTTRLGGHFVQGHVDGVGLVRDLRREGENGFLTVELPRELARYCVAEGSIAIDGVSLTIAELRDPRIVVNVIPVTWEATSLGDRRPGDQVNIEVDIIGRYVARMMGLGDAGRGAGTDASSSLHSDSRSGSLTAEKLTTWGYGQ